MTQQAVGKVKDMIEDAGGSASDLIDMAADLIKRK
jgi:uncharacterized protein YjbJ (UPF0337 family)